MYLPFDLAIKLWEWTENKKIGGCWLKFTLG